MTNLRDTIKLEQEIKNLKEDIQRWKNNFGNLEQYSNEQQRDINSLRMDIRANLEIIEHLESGREGAKLYDDI